MFELLKDLLLIGLGAGIGIVTIAIIQAGSMADKRMEEMKTERNEEK